MESRKSNDAASDAYSILKSCASTSNKGTCKHTGILDYTKVRLWMLHFLFDVF